MPTTCPPGAPVVAVGAPVIGAVAANVDFTQANIQTENLFACAFDGTGAQVGWVFKVIEDNLGEGANAALTQETLKLVDATGRQTILHREIGEDDAASARRLPRKNDC